MPLKKIVCPREIKAEVIDNKKISVSEFLLTLRGKISLPLPGQFVMLGLPRGTRFFLRRPFSVLDFEPKTDRLQIYFSVRGGGTLALSQVRRGDKLELLGPLGKSFPRGIGGADVIVGGGRGVAPLIFLSRKRHKTRDVLFFAGAACEEKLVFLDRIRARKIFVSTEDGSLGKKGTVLELLDSVASSTRLDWSRATLYGCGPVGMLKGLHRLSLKLMAQCFVSLEARMGCGVGVCQGCAVKNVESGYELVCKEGPVFNSAQIDWESYSADN